MGRHPYGPSRAGRSDVIEIPATLSGDVCGPSYPCLLQFHIGSIKRCDLGLVRVPQLSLLPGVGFRRGFAERERPTPRCRRWPTDFGFILRVGYSRPVHVTGARSSTDRASDYGSEGWGFESLRARTCASRSPAQTRRKPPETERLGGLLSRISHRLHSHSGLADRCEYLSEGRPGGLCRAVPEARTSSGEPRPCAREEPPRRRCLPGSTNSRKSGERTAGEEEGQAVIPVLAEHPALVAHDQAIQDVADAEGRTRAERAGGAAADGRAAAVVFAVPIGGQPTVAPPVVGHGAGAGQPRGPARGQRSSVGPSSGAVAGHQNFCSETVSSCETWRAFRGSTVGALWLRGCHAAGG